jgi:penicillin-binding protein 2
VSSASRALPRRDAGHRRVMVIATSVVFAFLVLIGQLWYLQVLEGGRFLDASDKNRIRVRPIAAPRGILFDRHGIPLVDNRPAFTLSLIPREMDRDPDKRDAALGRLASLIQIPYQELRDAVAKTSPDSFLPVRVRRNLSMEEMQKVEEWKLELPGVIVEVEPQRVYPSSRFASSVCSSSSCAARTAVSASRSTRWDGRCGSSSRPIPTRARRSSPPSTAASRTRPSARWKATRARWW